ncbi:glycosyl hydrolase family 32 [Nocardioides guangzhouensis]|nr:glycosyl hydrolase family 32 [Nocardioides guangzhouensis]
MAFHLPGHRVWDFWLATDGPEHHLFFLHAPETADPDERHQMARIGHAVSTDLRDWELLPRPLSDSPIGAADDRATWTGSTVRAHDGRWHLFYTGVSSAEDGRVQRVLSAVSDDLRSWERTDVVVEADPVHYEAWQPGVDDADQVDEVHWRDPWVHWDADAGVWRMYVTARVHDGAPDGRGTIAMATSPDLERWTVHGPVTEPGEFRQMEVSQLLPADDGWVLLFCHGPGDNSAARLDRGEPPEGGQHAYVGDSPAGPFRPAGDSLFVRGDPPPLYACRAVEHDGRSWLLGWPMVDAGGAFLGGISDPFPLQVGRYGASLATAPDQPAPSEPSYGPAP